MMWEFGTGYGWMLLWMAVFWGATILLVVWGVRQFTAKQHDRDSRAQGILEERYARGEIDRGQFESMHQTLDGSSLLK